MAVREVAMLRLGWLILTIAAAAGMAVGAVPRSVGEAVVLGVLDATAVDDPFPIRRVRCAETHLAALVKEFGSEPLVWVPRADFERRVRAAGHATTQAKAGARVVEATYTAELVAGDLIGSAEFSILNMPGAAGFLPLDPCRLAVQSATWKEGGVAIVAMPPSSVAALPVFMAAPAVWVEREGRSTLQLKWSLNGTTEPGERRFELRIPACPAATLHLLLPTGLVPAPPSDVLLTGPFDVPGRPLRRWQLQLGGRSRLDIAVRAGGTPTGAAAASLDARYDLIANQLTATFEYDLRPARGSVGEWLFLAHPGLRITEVVANNRAGWSVDPPAKPGNPRQVRVLLRQPGPGGKVRITAVAPLPDAARPVDVSLPTVRPVGAVINSERVEVHIAPGLRLESVTSGDYRLDGVTEFSVRAPELPQVLSFVGTLLPPGTNESFRRMPTLRLGSPEVEFATSERLDWRPGPEYSVLVVQVHVRVWRGTLYQMLVRPPPGYTLDRSVAPDEVVSHVGAPTGAGQPVEFARPLVAGQNVELRLEFRGPGVAVGEAVPFPAFAVVGATERDGWLSIATDPALAVTVQPGAGANSGGLWGWFTTNSPPDARAVFTFRAREPDGIVVLTPARSVISADALVQVDAVADRWHATTRLTVHVTGDAMPALAVFVSGPPDSARHWKVLDGPPLVEAVAMPSELLGMANIRAPLHPLVSAFGVRAPWHNGTVWVLRFVRPLLGTLTIQTTASGPSVGAAAVSLPVPWLLSGRQNARVEVVPGLQTRVEAALVGGEVRAAPMARPGLGPNPVSDAYLVTAVRGPDDVLVAFGGTIRNSPGGTLEVVLPPGAEVRSVSVGGRWLAPIAATVNGVLPVTVPTGAAVRFEVRYTLPLPRGWPTCSIASPTPGLPGDPRVRRWWVFAPGMLPGWPARPWDASAEPPPLLGGLLVGEPGAMLTEYDSDWVRVGTAQAADAMGVSFATLLMILSWVAARRGRIRAITGLAVILLGTTAMIQLGPPWWARTVWYVLCSSVIGIGAVLVERILRRNDLAVRVGSTDFVVASGVMVLFLVVVPAAAQLPTPVTVFIVPGADGAEQVVATQSLLDRLDKQARPPMPPAVVSVANYDVQVEDATATVTARLTVQTFGSGDNAVALPLTDARLERLRVGTNENNMKEAFPQAPRPDVYTVALGGPGRYEIEARFTVAVIATGPERELKFGIPEVPQTRLVASLSGSARQPQTVGRVGRQVVSTGDRITVEADLGAAKVVHLRWRDGAGGAAALRIREACIWDISDTGAELTCAYLVRVEQGTASSLRFDIPAELEVLRVAARAGDPPGAPLALQDWNLGAESGNRRQLRLDFQSPVAGRLIVILECAPRYPVTRQPVLRFPRIVLGSGGGQIETVYGLRTARVTVEDIVRPGMIDFPADALRDFAAVPDLRLSVDSAVKVFRPGAGGGELRPTLRVDEPIATTTATTWHVGPYRADAAGTVAWEAKEPLPLLELTLPGVKLSEVRGLEVARWSQTGGRVQVWLRAAARTGSLEWYGIATPLPQPKNEPAFMAFELPHPQVVNGNVLSHEVRVRPVTGLAVRPDRFRGWEEQPAPPGERRYRTALPAAPPLRVQLLSAR